MRFVLALTLSLLAGCSATGSEHDLGALGEFDWAAPSVERRPPETPGQRRARASLIENFIRRFAMESGPIFGADTDTFPVTWTMVLPQSDGSLEVIYQEIDVAHAEVDTEYGRKLLYRVGMIAGTPHILLRARNISKRFEVLWESWPGNMRREGDPPSKYIRYFFYK
jgi:hypothetical protein